MQPNRLHLLLLGVIGLLALAAPDPNVSATPQTPEISAVVPTDFGDVGIVGELLGAPADVSSQSVAAAAPAPDIEPDADSDAPAFPEVEELPAPPEPVAGIAPAAAVDHSFTQAVFPVQCANGDGGSAVAIGPTTLVTAQHVVERAGSQCRVTVNGQQYLARITPIPGADNRLRDAAFLSISGVQLPYLSIREPEYFEPARLYGLRTNQVQTGFVTADRTVSLDPQFPGTRQGDSGGAIVGEDGSLIGIISGSDQTNANVAKMCAATVFAQHVPRAATFNADALAFDPPEPARDQAPSCAAPSCSVNNVPQQSYAPATRFCRRGVCRPRGRLFRLFR